jgi:Predicted membrane protein (DUF2243)
MAAFRLEATLTSFPRVKVSSGPAHDCSRGAGYPPRIVSVQAATVDVSTATSPRPSAFIMGLGLGGFIDGIVLHQILQWHHMLTDTGDHPSNTVAGLEANTLADGFFHLAT